MRGVLLALLLALMLPAGADGAFPGSDPSESPRINTPDDPEFDRCEGDNEEAPPSCGAYAEEEFRAFGFSPDSANTAPPAGPHYVTGTRYTNCDQLNAEGRAANVRAEGVQGDPLAQPLAECLQIAGVRSDLAWKYDTGNPQTAVAILDTGIRWQAGELRTKVRLNRGELPLPQGSVSYDRNGDGAFNVDDYAGQVDPAAGDEEADGVLDASDLIATFSDGTDADGNGYVDDIAGWDFFDDDNDPFDASSCCSANGHGTGRATEAVGATNNGQSGAGMCPECQVMPLRVWDTFVVPTDNYAMGVMYAADNGASVVEGAVGGLTNTQFARQAFAYADAKGLALMLVSSDINSANHNYPTNYNEAIYVAGSLYDTAPNDTCGGLPGLPGVGDLPSPPDEFSAGCQELLTRLGLGSSIGQPFTTSFFRNSNLTQYGGKADVVMMGSTGSENTGQASGAAGLLMAYGRERLAAPLTGNEVRQLLTMTAEDVLPENTGVIGLPDKAVGGWDPHFGYGRVDLAAAMQRIKQGRIPPEAQIDAPDWYAPINVDRVGAGGVEIRGRAQARGGVGAWEIAIACGQDTPDASFEPLLSGTGAVAGSFGAIPKAELAALASTCDGEVTGDAGRPAGTAAGAWPADPYPDPDPERHAFQIRLTVHAAGDPGNVGRYRKTLHAYEDDGNLPGWPRPVGSGADGSIYRTAAGGEASPRLYDVDGDNALDLVVPTSSGELHVLRADGAELPGFPVTTDRYALERNHPVPLAGAAVPRESLRVPAIGDVDGDRDPEIVATAGEHLYAWELDGSRAFVAGAERSLSEPCKPGIPKPCFDAADRAITSSNHIKRGFAGSAVLAQLDPGTPGLEIVAGGLDQHVYAWRGDGTLLPGFPRRIATAGADGAEIITTPAIADLDGEGPPEIVVATNEVAPGEPEFPGSFFEFASAILQAATGYNPVYALHADGTMVDGWPVKVGVAAGDLLPLVLPGHDAAVIDADGGTDEVAVSAGTAVVPGGGSRLVDGAGATVSSFETSNGNRADPGAVLNLADYASAGDVLGTGRPQILKGGLTVNGAANLLAVNQNLPFNHVEQLWSPASPAGSYVDPGPSAPGFPLATDDFQLVSQASVARVGGGGPGRQALVGTGLYQVHAYGTGGAEPAGWPKFTGGWTQATPAVGDADGDGDLDVTTLTREGWTFLWDTGVGACDGANDQWWTFHHDEHSTNNHTVDARPPGTPTQLAAVRDGADVLVTLTMPGDDWLCGTPAMMLVNGAERDAAATLRLTSAELGAADRVTVRFADEAGNWGHAASVAVPPSGEPTGGGDGAPSTAPCPLVRRGTPRADLLRGTARGDRLVGRGGDDRILGEQGPDCLLGGRGMDRLRGGRGRDRLRGGAGADRLSARGGARGSAPDVVDCGPGRDVARVDRRDRVRRCEKVRRR
jgi:subtilase family protein/hemolysin type calcium-binding protein